MQLEAFYRAILPDTGQLVLFQNKRHSFFEDIESLVLGTEARLEQQGVYFGTASFGEAQNRTQENVRLLKAYRVDIDAGAEKYAKHPADVYQTQREALSALVQFIKDTQLAPTLIVSSGEGLHVYWCLDEAVEPDAWRPVARQLNGVGKRFSLKIDAACTADTARVLRPVGTLHKNGSRVTVLRNTGVTYTHEAFAARVAELAPADDFCADPLPRKPGRPANDINADILAFDGPPSSLALVAERCNAVALMRDTGGRVPEPHWRAVIGLAKYTEDGETLIHEWSKGYEGYSYRETQEKFDRWETPPSTCAHFDTMNEGCKSCPHRGKITTPKQLGYISRPPAESVAPVTSMPVAAAAPVVDTEAAELAVNMAMDEPAPEVEARPAAAPAPQPISNPDDPVPGRPDLFDQSAELFYKKSDGRWVLFHRTRKQIVDPGNPEGPKLWTEVVKPIFYKLVWCEYSSAPGASDTDGVMSEWCIVHKPETGIVTRYSMANGTIADKGTLEKFLLDQGVNPDPTNEKARDGMRAFILREVIRVQNDMRFVVKDRFGYHYHEGQFICAMGNYTIYPDGRIQRTMVNPKLRGVSDNLTIGCLPPKPEGVWGADGWQAIGQGAADYIKFLRAHYGHQGYEPARLALALTLASPLLVFTADAAFKDQPELPPVGFVLSLYSRGSGQGKSSIQEVVAAAYGKPALKRAGKKALLTDVAAATLAKSMAIYPFILDEVTENEAHQAANMVDTFANGSGRIRARQDGSAPKSAETWALISCVSTNVPQRELISITQKRSDALLMRLLELDFDNLPTAGDAVQFGEDLKAVSSACGAFGALLSYLAVKAGPERLVEMGRRNLDRAYAVLGAPQQYRFFARGLAAMMSMNELLDRWAPFAEDELVETFKAAVASTTWYVQANRKSAATELQAMLGDLSANIAVTRTFSKGGQDILLTPHVRHPVVGREVQDWGVVMIESSALHKWCATNQMSSKHFIAELEKLGLIVTRDGKNKFSYRLTTGLPSLPSQRGWYYMIRTRREAVAVDGSSNVVALRSPDEPTEPQAEDTGTQ